MKIRRGRFTSSISFGLTGEDDQAFKDWMAECHKPGVGYVEAAERVKERQTEAATAK